MSKKEDLNSSIIFHTTAHYRSSFRNEEVICEPCETNHLPLISGASNDSDCNTSTSTNPLRGGTLHALCSTVPRGNTPIIIYCEDVDAIINAQKRVILEQGGTTPIHLKTDQCRRWPVT